MNMPGIILASALLFSCFVAQAQQVAPDAAVATQANAQPATQDKVADEPYCLRYTGSLIVAHENRKNDRASAGATTKSKPKCNGSAGNSYSREDISRTGAIDLADALRNLDPAVH